MVEFIFCAELEKLRQNKYDYKLSLLCGAALHLFECTNKSQEQLETNFLLCGTQQDLCQIFKNSEDEIQKNLTALFEKYPKPALWPLWNLQDTFEWLEIHQIQTRYQYSPSIFHSDLRFFFLK